MRFIYNVALCEIDFYDEFVTAYKGTSSKGFFSYDWLYDYVHINTTELPTHEACSIDVKVWYY